MNDELLKRVEKLEDEIQDLTKKLEHITTAVLIVIRKVDPVGYEESCIDVNDNNIS